MPEPLITTIIPTFRRPQLLRRAISSVLRQTYGNFQVCVYDNASGDGTADVVAELARSDSRITYHCHPENIGGGANFNYALARINTPYFSFLSDDDVLLPEFYEAAMQGFESFPEAGFFAGSTIVMSDQGKVLTVPLDLWRTEGCFSPPAGFLNLLRIKVPVWTSILFRKAITDKIGILDLEVGSAADLDYQLQAACRAPFIISRKPCGIFVSHDDSFSATPSLDSCWPGWLKMVGRITGNANIPDDIRNQAVHALTLFIEEAVFSIGLRLIRVGNIVAAREAADILRRHLGKRFLSFLLAASARACSRGRLPIKCFAFVYDLAHAQRDVLLRGGRALQARYGVYAKWL